MRILLLSCNTGEGHNSTARAIMEVLEPKGITCDLQDTLAYLSPKFSRFICNWHVRLYKYAPKLFNGGYHMMERPNQGPEDQNLMCDILAYGAEKVRDVILENGYDAVICVHIFSGAMMTEVRKKWGIDIPCFFVATDYTCSPMANHCEMDGYFSPSGELVREFTDSGLPGDRMLPYGIPVRQEFYTRREKIFAREQLWLPQDKTVVLLMCGSMGCGPMKEITRSLLQRLPDSAEVVAVCGNNEKLQETLLCLEDRRLRALGFSDRIPLYMDAADLVITKPGGLSSTEAANKHLPIVFINAVGGCEDRNFEFFLSHGYALGSSSPEEVIELAAELAENPEHREELSRNLRKAFSENSARKIADTVIRAADRHRENAEV